MNNGVDMTLNKIATFFGVDPKTGKRWIESGCPARKDQQRRWTLNSAEVSAWLQQRERTAALGEIGDVSLQDAKRRRTAAEATLAEIKAATAAGAVVAISDFEASLAAMIGTARAKLLNLGSKLGPLMPQCETATEAKDLIDGAVVEVLKELATDELASGE